MHAAKAGVEEDEDDDGDADAYEDKDEGGKEGALQAFMRRFGLQKE